MMEMHRSAGFPLEKLCTFYDAADYQQVLRDISEGKVRTYADMPPLYEYLGLPPAPSWSASYSVD